MPATVHLKDIAASVGSELGVSRWFTVDQTMIDRFADATEDHQFIHTDPERGGRNALRRHHRPRLPQLSLLSAMNYDCIPRIVEQTMGINYGFGFKVRFITPVKSGARVRGRFVLDEARFRGAGMLTVRYNVTVEIEDERNPASRCSGLRRPSGSALLQRTVFQ